MTTVHFIRTDREGAPSFREFLTLCTLDGSTVVQVTSGAKPGDELLGLFSLDGDRLDIGNAEWSVATDVHPDVIAEVEQDWAGASLRVQRCDSHGEVIGGG